MKRIRSIARAISAAMAVFVNAVGGAMRASRHPASSATLSVKPGPLRADGVADKRNAQQLVQPYPDEVEVDGRTIELPQPSFWPMVLAFGVTLLFFGLVTNIGISIAGALVLAWAIVGWIGEIRHD